MTRDRNVTRDRFERALFRALRPLVIAVLFAITAFPLYYMVMLSFRDIQPGLLQCCHGLDEGTQVVLVHPLQDHLRHDVRPTEDTGGELTARRCHDQSAHPAVGGIVDSPDHVMVDQPVDDAGHRGQGDL